MIIEKAIDNTRSDYYFHLQNESKDITAFVEYFLEILASSATSVLTKITQPETPQFSHALLPRRQELLDIILDHHVVVLTFSIAGLPAFPVVL